MARMPGAVWRPIPVSSSRPVRRKGRGVCYHVAVSEAESLYGYFSTAAVDSHFYVAKSGVIEQYVDTDLVAYANAEGNGTLISVETQGGLYDTEAEPWTDAQLAANARIAKWAHDTEGVPLRLMKSSLPTERGLGWHKLGVKPWVVPGGEVWSSSYGKVCPGLAKIHQMPEVLQRSLGTAPNPEDTLPTTADVWGYDVASDMDAVQSAKNVLAQTWTNSRSLLTQVAALTKAVTSLQATEAAQAKAIGALSALVAQQNGLTVEQVREVVSAEIAKGVDVDVTVQPGTDPAP